MAAAFILGFGPLSLRGASPEPGWWRASHQGFLDFFDVERLRNTLLVVLSVLAFLWLIRQVMEKMLLAPMRRVLIEELKSLHRSGLAIAGLDEGTIDDLDVDGGSAQEKEQRFYRALLLLRDSTVSFRKNELDNLSGPALIWAAAAVRDKLTPPVDTYLEATELTDPKSRALREVLLEISREQASNTAIETRLLLRRLRKSQALSTAGALLLILLVVLFGNPALVAFGVLGAVVSRMISFFASSTDEGQKYHWAVLMLTPVVGGLSGFAGVLLVDAMRTWEVLGDVFKDVHFGAESASMATLAAAFLFGFTERLLDSVAGKAADGLAPIMAEDPTPGGGGGGTTTDAPEGGGHAVEPRGTPADAETQEVVEQHTDDSSPGLTDPGRTTGP
ncbi:hypothetical protein [Ornithinimicrobium flavum]|uniref:hypothetical protein n=1 Tax=Ornithinimicrobium flavum TaxID=1288636 RepID=UPI00107043C5|nr:hypothetical protein [Ornithinimicrobium flavum]